MRRAGGEVVGTFSDLIAAEAAAAALRVEGFAPTVTSDDAGGMEPQLRLSRGVHVVVAPADAERARAALAAAGLLEADATAVASAGSRRRGPRRLVLATVVVLVVAEVLVVLSSVLAE